MNSNRGKGKIKIWLGFHTQRINYSANIFRIKLVPMTDGDCCLVWAGAVQTSFADLPVHLAHDLQFLSYSNPTPLPGSNSWPCQIAWWFCDMHKWGLGWDHPTCFHLQAKPGCKAESPEEKGYGTNPLCHLASTVQKSYSDAASASFSDVLWLCNNQPAKNCNAFPSNDSQNFCFNGLCCHRVANGFYK